MRHKALQLDFGDAREPRAAFTRFERIIEDRGSHYSVCLGRVTGRDDIATFLTTLKADPCYATATHNSWAARITRAGAIYETQNDDGETGASAVILRTMQQANVTNAIVCVTRWFGGVKLEQDRYKHLQDATRYALKTI